MLPRPRIHFGPPVAPESGSFQCAPDPNRTAVDCTMRQLSLRGTGSAKLALLYAVQEYIGAIAQLQRDQHQRAHNQAEIDFAAFHGCVSARCKHRVVQATYITVGQVRVQGFLGRVLERPIRVRCCRAAGMEPNNGACIRICIRIYTVSATATAKHGVRGMSKRSQASDALRTQRKSDTELALSAVLQGYLRNSSTFAMRARKPTHSSPSEPPPS